MDFYEISQFSRAKNCFTSVQKICIKLSIFKIYILPVFNINLFFSVQEPEHSHEDDHHTNLTVNHNIILKHLLDISHTGKAYSE